MGWLRDLWYTIKDAIDFTKAEPRHVGMGAAFGVFLGCVPESSGLVVLLAFLIGLTDTSAFAAFVVGLATKGLSIMVLDPTSWSIGQKVCESDWANAHASWFSAPGIALLGLERYHVMGGTLLGLLAAVPAFIVGRRVWQVYHLGRSKAAEKLAAMRKKKTEGATGEGAATDAAAAAAGTEEKKDSPEDEAGDGLLKRIYHSFPRRTWAMVVLLICLDLFGMKSVVRWGLQKKFPESLAKAMGVVNPDGTVKQMGKVTWSDADYEVSFLKGKIRMSDFHIANPKDPSHDLFAAKAVEVRLDRFALLKRQFVLELVELDAPEVAVARQDDGSLSVEPVPAPGTGATAQAQGQGADWAQRARDAFERLKKQQDERKKKQQEEEKKKAQEKAEGKKPEPTPEQKKKLERPTTLAEAEDRASAGIPGANPRLASPPRWIVRRVETNGLDVRLNDPKAAQPAPGLSFKQGLVLEIPQDRTYDDKPSECHLDGSVVDAQKKAVGGVKLDFALDPPAADGETGWKLAVRLSDVSLHDTDALFAAGVPLEFEKGTATISLDATGKGLDGALDAAPKIALKDVVAQPRDPSKPIVGMDANKVAQEVTNAGTFELNDVKVTGSVLAPSFDMGNTLKDLVVQGGLNYAKKAAAGAVDKGLEKLGQKVPGAADKVDDAKKAAGGLLEKGLGGFGLGGSDDKK